MKWTARTLAAGVLAVGIAAPAFSFPRPDEENMTLRRDIAGLNLLNGLYLSREQLAKYVDLLDRLKATEDKLVSDVKPAIVARQRAAFTALRDELAKGQGASEAVERDAHQANEEGKRALMDAMQQVKGFEDEIRGILTENQLSIAEKFKPCLVPPKWLGDPARVGQASGDGAGVAKVLERVREIPEARYETAKDRIFEKYIEKKEEHEGEMTEVEKAAEKTRVTAILDEARSLPQVDFEMKKKDLAGELVPEEDGEPRGFGKNRLSPLGKTLLNTDLLPILKARLATPGTSDKP